jgi:hypothetical protein
MEDFASEFMERLRSYLESSGKDTEAYGWLIHRSNKMQIQLGPEGVLAAYKPPFANFQYQNYPVVLNLLPELRRALEDNILSGQHYSHQYGMLLQETLIRHGGSLHDRAETLARSLKNPLAWLREGVRAMVALPLSVLAWVGLLSEATVGRITGSKIFRVLSGFAAIIGFVSAVMGIALGWEAFVQFAAGWWKRFF